MIRRLYARLIRLHPRAFRENFGEEMMAIFDEASASPRGSYRLVGDAILSLIRQWAFRPEFHAPEVRAAADGAMFASLERYRMRSAALIYGGVFTIALFSAVIFAIDHPGKTPRWLIGMHRAVEGLLPVSRSSLSEASPNTLVELPKEKVNPWKAIAFAYFQHMPLLTALDENGDYVISSREMIFAPGPLRTLDRDKDGKLTPEELGCPPGQSPEIQKRFMLIHPILRALDSSHDGEISTAEIYQSTITLRTLDTNHDDFLTPDEIMPR